jgi:hypothetical protein
MDNCDCKSCRAVEKMQEIHKKIISEKREPTCEEMDEMDSLMQLIML